MFFFSCGNNQSDAGAVAETPAYPVFAVKAQTATLKTNYPASLQGEQNIEICEGHIQLQVLLCLL